MSTTHLLTIAFGVVAAALIFFLTFPFWTVLIALFRNEKLKEEDPTDKQFDYGCIITAYKNADIAKPLIHSLLRQTHRQHHIYLVADACEIENWDIVDPRFTLLVPNEPLNLKAKSIIYAVERFVRDHEFTVIFDADNLAHPDFLAEINRYANEGYLSIQGQRTAKNLDTTMAAADSLGEFYKNYTERYVPFMLGSAAVISGSGMAVQTDIYKSYLYGKEIQEGQHLWKKMLQEDKILQNHLVRKDIRTAYATNAICYDEKASSGKAIETQRSRWLFSYFQNLPNSTGLIMKGLRNGSWNQLFFGLVTVNLPMFILLGISMLVAVVSLFVNVWFTAALVAAMGIFALNILFCLHLSSVPPQVWQAVWAMPKFVFRQFTALFKMFNPNKNFKHSEHKVSVSVDEVLIKSK